MPFKKPSKITIKDVARACKVSTQTVSRVINQRPDVSPETRAAVEKTIAELGYMPSALARSLVQQRSFTLGVIISGLKQIGIAKTLNGIAEQCEALNYALLMKYLPRFDTPDIVPVIETLMTHHVDGIIFAGPEWNENIKTAQAQIPANCPPIIFLKCLPTPNYTTISIDNYGGAYAAVDYLISLGRDRIGLIAGPLEWLEARKRKQGWEDAMKNAGVEVSARQWSAGDWSSASGTAAMTEIMQKYPEINAVFASNDQMALGVLHYAHMHGLRVPEDLAVIGFDNLIETPYFIPPLTTVEQPLGELGTQAVKTLVEQIESEGADRVVNTLVLNTHLVVRESTPKKR